MRDPPAAREPVSSYACYSSQYVSLGLLGNTAIEAYETGGPEDQDQCEHGSQHDLVPVTAEREQVLLGDQECGADQGPQQDAASDQHDGGEHKDQKVGFEHVRADIGAL